MERGAAPSTVFRTLVRLFIIILPVARMVVSALRIPWLSLDFSHGNGDSKLVITRVF